LGKHIPALLITLKGGKLVVTSSRLDSESLKGLAAGLPEASACSVYVIRTGEGLEIKSLPNLSDLLEDRGNLDSRGLCRQLRGSVTGPRVALVQADYAGAGRALQSLKPLLANAHKLHRALVLIAVDSLVFDELQENAVSPAEQPLPGSAALSPARASGMTRTDGLSGCLIERPVCAGCKEAVQLLRGLPDPPVPTALVEISRRYFGLSPEAVLVRRLIILAAQGDFPVLVLGPSGTGKEIIARAIYDGMCVIDRRNRKRDFVALNCGGIPDELLESELFGYVKGSFTGATRDKKGLWELAGNGVLFLDEIGDLPAHQQAKILRVLEEKRIRPIGGLNDIEVYARVIAATNRDLPAMVKVGLFREDLYQRLKGGFPILTPALDDHPEDIGEVAQLCWASVWRERQPGEPELPVPYLCDGALEALRKHRWPGNIRELKNLLRTVRQTCPQGPWDQAAIEVALARSEVRSRGRLSYTTSPTGIWRHLDDTTVELRRCQLAMERFWSHARTGGRETRELRSAILACCRALEERCEHPLLFGTTPTFSRVCQILTRLADLVEGPASDTSMRMIQDESVLKEALNQTFAALFEESGRLSNYRQPGWIG